MTQEAETQVSEAVKEQAIPDLFDMFAVDVHLVEEGAPMVVGSTTFRIARGSRRKFKAAVQKGYFDLFTKYSEDERNPDKNPEKAAQYMAEVQELERVCYAKHILVGWDVLKYRGKVYNGYDEKTAYEILGMQEFFERVDAFCSNRANYLPTLDEAEAKN